MFLETLINLIMIGVECIWFVVIMKTRSPTIFPSFCYSGIITLKPIELQQDKRIGFLCILIIHSQDGIHMCFLFSSLLFFKTNQKPKQEKKHKGQKECRRRSETKKRMLSLSSWHH